MRVKNYIPTEVEIAWASGVIEGEGSFVTSGYRRRIQVGMCDEDILQRLYTIFKVGKVFFSHNTSTGKPFYFWNVGKKAEVKTICELILPFMGERRSKKIRELLEKC